jgi:hypothetical protein
MMSFEAQTKKIHRAAIVAVIVWGITTISVIFAIMAALTSILRETPWIAEGIVQHGLGLGLIVAVILSFIGVVVPQLVLAGFLAKYLRSLNKLTCPACNIQMRFPNFDELCKVEKCDHCGSVIQEK